MRSSVLSDMRVTLRSTIIVLVLLPLVSASADSPKDELKALFDSYTTLFNSGDTATIADAIFNAPVQFAGDWGQEIWLTEEDVSSGFAETIKDLRQRGWDRSVTNAIEVCVATEHLAFVVMRYSRLDTSGKPIPPIDRSGLYVVSDASGDWRIVAAYDYDPDTRFNCSD